MKSILQTARAIGLFLVIASLGGSAFAGTIRGSKHDFSIGGGITDKSINESKVCIFCHTPHSARPAVPLWNRTISPGGMTYLLYSNPPGSGPTGTMQSSPAFGDTGDPGNMELLGGPSRLCLSCHDGTISVADILNRFPDDSPPTMGSGNELDLDGSLDDTGAANIGEAAFGAGTADLSNDHPISFVYSSSLASSDGTLHDPEDPSHTEIQDLLTNYSAATGGNFECSSCHDPHDPDNPPFLIMDNFQSALCRVCHNK
jgi:predicted CXXCH cytochrome family protein